MHMLALIHGNIYHKIKSKDIYLNINKHDASTNEVHSDDDSLLPYILNKVTFSN